MKITFGDILVPAILIGAVGWWGYNTWTERSGKAATEKARIEAQSDYGRGVAEMARKHQATRALTDKLAEGGTRVFTYQVQNALMAATGNAVLITGNLVDIEKQDGLCLLHIDDANAAGVAIRYIVECEARTAQQLMGRRTDSGLVTAAVQISSVEKAEFRLSGQKGAGAELKVELDASTRFLARGRCLEVLPR